MSNDVLNNKYNNRCNDINKNNINSCENNEKKQLPTNDNRKDDRNNKNKREERSSMEDEEMNSNKKNNIKRMKTKTNNKRTYVEVVKSCISTQQENKSLRTKENGIPQDKMISLVKNKPSQQDDERGRKKLTKRNERDKKKEEEKPSTLWYCKVQYNGKEYSAMIDSGSQVSAIRDGLTSDKEHINTTNVQLYQAGSKDLPCKGTIMATLKLSVHDKLVKLFIIPNLNTDILLGQDFIQQYVSNIDVDNKNMMIKDGNTIMLETKEGKNINLVISEQPTSKRDLREEDQREECLPPGVTLGGVKEKTMREELIRLIQEYKNIFSKGEDDVGRVDPLVCQHKINLKDKSQVTRTRAYKHSPQEMEAIEKQLKTWEKLGIIRRSKSPYCSGIVLAKKHGGGIRICIDYRRLNALTQGDAYPVPRIGTLLEQLAGSSVFTTLDLMSGYLQVPMEKSSIKYTAFSEGYDLYEFVVMPFGLTTAPLTFQRMMNELFSNLVRRSVLIYVDDVVVYSKSGKEHLEHLREVFKVLEQAGLKLKGSKCRFAQDEIVYLGHKVSGRGLQADNSRFAAVQQLAVPRDKKEVQHFLGLVGWYRQYIPNFAHIAEPLTLLTRKDEVWRWNKEQEQAFQTLKEALVTGKILAFPDLARRFRLRTDASDVAAAAVLEQRYDNEWKPCAFWSKTFEKAERNYSTSEREAYAAYLAMLQYRQYLIHRPFTLITDHASLRYLRKAPKLYNRKWERYVMDLEEFQYDIEYKPGKSNTIADALSRLRKQAGERDEGTICSYPPTDNMITITMVGAITRTQKRMEKEEEARRQRNPQQPTTQEEKEKETQSTHKSGTQDKINEQQSPQQEGKYDDDENQSQLEKQQRAWDKIKEMKSKDTSGKEEETSCIKQTAAAQIAMKETPLFDPEISLHNIKQQQKKDQFIETIKKNLRDDKGRIADTYCVINDVLYKKQHNKLLVVIPKNIATYIIQKAHEDVLAGHQGVQSTANRLRSFGWCRQFMPLVEEVVRQCTVCQRHRRQLLVEPAATNNSSIIVDRPFKRIAMDFVGELDTTSEGYKYILVIIDLHTRYVVARPTKDQTSETVAKTLVDEWITKPFGIPDTIMSDNGKSFVSETMMNVYKMLGINKVNTVPYMPQHNGHCERVNSSIMKQLRMHVEQVQDKTAWQERLQTAVAAYNTSIHSATGYSPAQLLFGFNPRMPIEMQIVDEAIEQPAKPIHNYIHQWLEELRVARKRAVLIQQEAVERREKDVTHDGQTTDKTVKIGDKVYLKRPAKSKLDNTWRGPYEVIGIESPQRIQIRLMGTPIDKEESTIQMAAPQQLKFAVDPMEEQDIRITENKTKQDEQPSNSLIDLHNNKWEVEKIVDSRTRGNKVEYKIRWKTGEDGIPWKDSWEPATNLDGAQQVIKEYNDKLNKKRVKRLISLMEALEKDEL